LHAESALRPTPPPPAIGPSVTLPAPAVQSADLAGVLSRRRAVRFFAAAPLDASVLIGALAEGFAADRRNWPDEQACCPLIPVVVAQNVAGLAPAVYRIEDDWAAAAPVMALNGPSDYETLTLQREFATAGAIVSLLGDLDAADRGHGGAGFRTLMTRAGALAYQTWLAAIGHGAVGSVFAGFLPAAVRTPMGCDGVRRHQLFALALGLPEALPVSVGAGPTARPEGRG
jgi:hypothetical protein